MNFMRKQLIFLAGGLILLSLAQPSMAVDRALWVSRGEKDNCSSFSLGYAWRSYALEVGFLNDVVYQNGIDYFGPWPDDYQLLGVEQRTSTGGLDLLFLVDLSKQFLIYGGLGLYYHELGQTVQDPDTGKKYNQYLTTETTLAHSIGLKYQWAKLQFGLGYHTIRGLNGQVGFVF
ncbi:MAG: hypothetical protein GX202_05345 [Firmicutes bacterium]|nr:hypothetical protein [Bacillota bacterium]